MMHIWNLMFMARAALGVQLGKLTREERGAVDIVAIVVMIGIAVLLAVVFRKQVEGLLDTLFEAIGKSAESAVSGGE